MNQNNKNFRETQEQQLSNALSSKLTVENHKQLKEHLLRSQVEKSLKGSSPPKFKADLLVLQQPDDKLSLSLVIDFRTEK